MNSFLLFLVAVLGTIIIVELYLDDVPYSTEQQPITETISAQSSQRNYSAVTTSEGNILLWNSRQNDTLILRQHDAAIQSLTFSTDGRWLISTDIKDNSILWATRKGNFVVQVSRLQSKVLKYKNLHFIEVDAFEQNLVFETTKGARVYFNYVTEQLIESSPQDVVRINSFTLLAMIS